MDDGRVQILGTGVSPADGIRRGVIVDESRLAAAVGDAVERAQHVGGAAFEDVTIGVGGLFMHGGGHDARNEGAESGAVVDVVRRLGLHPVGVVPTALAAARATAAPPSSPGAGETAIVDIGAWSTEVVVFHDGRPVLRGVVPVGGQHVTNDIAYGLNVPVDEAERLKVRYGAAVDELPAAGVQGGRQRSAKSPGLFDIVEPRVAELLELVAAQLADLFAQHPPRGGIVLTGGSALLGGMQQAAERTFGAPVRIGVADKAVGPVEVVTGPMYAGVIGLLYEAQPTHSDVPVAQANGAQRRSLLESVRDWLTDFL